MQINITQCRLEASELQPFLVDVCFTPGGEAGQSVKVTEGTSSVELDSVEAVMAKVA